MQDLVLLDSAASWKRYGPRSDMEICSSFDLPISAPSVEMCLCRWLLNAAAAAATATTERMTKRTDAVVSADTMPLMIGQHVQSS